MKSFLAKPAVKLARAAADAESLPNLAMANISKFVEQLKGPKASRRLSAVNEAAKLAVAAAVCGDDISDPKKKAASTAMANLLGLDQRALKRARDTSPHERVKQVFKPLFRKRRSYRDNSPFTELLLDFVENNTTPDPASRGSVGVVIDGAKSRHTKHYLGTSSFRFLREFRVWLHQRGYTESAPKLRTFQSLLSDYKWLHFRPVVTPRHCCCCPHHAAADFLFEAFDKMTKECHEGCECECLRCRPLGSTTCMARSSVPSLGVLMATAVCNPSDPETFTFDIMCVEGLCDQCGIDKVLPDCPLELTDDEMTYKEWKKVDRVVASPKNPGDKAAVHSVIQLKKTVTTRKAFMAMMKKQVGGGR